MSWSLGVIYTQDPEEGTLGLPDDVRNLETLGPLSEIIIEIWPSEGKIRIS